MAQPGMQNLVAGGERGKALLRPYRADGFSVRVPADWIDRTVHSFTLPPQGDFQPMLCVSADSECVSESVESFADDRIRLSLETMPGSRLGKREKAVLAGGTPAVRAEVRWFPTDGQKLYQHLLFVVRQGAGFTISAQLTKKTRSTLGPMVDRIMQSFSALAPPAPAAQGRQESGHRTYQADRFAIVLEEGWSEETVYVLVEPKTGGFLRNLVMRKDRLESPDTPLADLAREEVKAAVAAMEGIKILSNEEMALQGRQPIWRFEYERPDGEDSAVAQFQVMAICGAFLHTLTLTAETDLLDAEKNLFREALVSFAAGGTPATPAAGAPGGKR